MKLCHLQSTPRKLTGVVLDDVHDLDVRGDFIKLRGADQSGLAVFQIDFQVGRDNSIAAAGDFSGYKALGYTDEQIALLQAAWDAANGGTVQNPGRGGVQVNNCHSLKN